MSRVAAPAVGGISTHVDPGQYASGRVADENDLVRVIFEQSLIHRACDLED